MGHSMELLRCVVVNIIDRRFVRDSSASDALARIRSHPARIATALKNGATRIPVMSDVIGRRAELETLDRFVARAHDGLASVLVVGEAGIGKTSVWAAGVRGATESGARILHSAPAESERSLTL